MNNSVKYFVVIRSGDSDGEMLALTTKGEFQIVSLRDHLDDYFSLNHRSLSLTWLVASFSRQKRATGSAKILANRKHEVILGDFYYTSREDIKELDISSIFNILIAKAKFNKASVIVVVAHGDMIPVLAEKAKEYFGDGKLTLRRVDPSSGYFVNLETGALMSVSQHGMTLIER